MYKNKYESLEQDDNHDDLINERKKAIKWKEYTCASFCTYMFIIIILLMSINFVRFDKYAFYHDVFTSVDTSKVLTHGTYFYPPWVKLEYFPSTFQYVNFFEQVFSDTGLEFDLEVIFYYRLKAENLASIYNLFSNNYKGIIISNSKQIIKDVGSKYNVEDYISRRGVIEEDIGLSLSKKLGSDIGVEILPNFVKITDIVFPTNVIQTNLLSAIAQQQNDVEINEQNYQAVLAETSLLVAQLNSEAQQILQFSTNQANMIVANTNNLCQNMIGKAKLEGIKHFFSTLNITNEDVKSQYINWFGIDQSQNTTFTIGFEANNIFLNKN